VEDEVDDDDDDDEEEERKQNEEEPRVPESHSIAVSLMEIRCAGERQKLVRNCKGKTVRRVRKKTPKVMVVSSASKSWKVTTAAMPTCTGHAAHAGHAGCQSATRAGGEGQGGGGVEMV